jgi:hypothetical protein
MSEAVDGPAGSALRIVRGDPTAEELAALTVLITAVAAQPAGPAPRVRRGGWNDPSRHHRPALVPGPNAWRASSLPH